MKKSIGASAVALVLAAALGAPSLVRANPSSSSASAKSESKDIWGVVGVSGKNVTLVPVTSGPRPTYVVAPGAFDSLLKSLRGKPVSVHARVHGLTARLTHIDAQTTRDGVVLLSKPDAKGPVEDPSPCPKGSVITVTGATPDGKFAKVTFQVGLPAEDGASAFEHGYVAMSDLDFAFTKPPFWVAAAANTPGAAGVVSHP